MLRKLYCEYVGEVFALYCGQQLDEVVPKIEVKTRILPLQSLSKEVMGQITELEGYLTFLYQRFVFGSAKTYVALAWAGEKLAHISWIIPQKKCRKRHSFVPEKAYMIAACQTVACFRGNRIFPFVLQQISLCGPECSEYWIFANDKSLPSLKGIEKSGARHVGRYVGNRWFFGILKSIKYYPYES